jgi:hypothetical protein
MSFTFEKVAELKYDELISLYIIETDDILKEIFEEKVKTPFNLLYTFIKDGGELVSSETKEVIFEMFDKLISTRVSLSERYKNLQQTGYVSKKIGIEQPITETIVKPTIEVVEPTVEAVKPTKAKKERELPRRYGKDKILKDIKEQDKPATPLQRAMIDLNDVRNLYVKMCDRGIKDMLGGGQNFTEEDCRKISAMIKTFKQQAEKIMNSNK